jgi:hypothetical protein
MPSHFWVFRLPAILLGAFVLYLALLIYPDERGKIQNRLIDLWVTFSRRGEDALGQTGQLVSGASKVVNDFLDKLFGQRLLSLKVLFVSPALSVGSATVVMQVIVRNFEGQKEIRYFMTAAVGVIIATLVYPFGKRLKPLLAAFAAACFLTSLWGFLNSFHGIDDPDPVKTIPLAIWVIVGGVLSDVVFVAITRKLLRWTSSVTSSPKLALGITAILLIGAVLAGPAAVVLLDIGPSMTSDGPMSPLLNLLGEGYGLLSFTNIVPGVISVLVILVLAVALVNRLIWSFMARPVFALVDFGVLNNRKLLATVGFSLLTLGFPIATHWISKLTDLPW